jgi:hypothetical protein
VEESGKLDGLDLVEENVEDLGYSTISITLKEYY